MCRYRLGGICIPQYMLGCVRTNVPLWTILVSMIINEHIARDGPIHINAGPV